MSQQQQQVAINLAIVERLRRLALVHQALQMAENGYIRIKHLNPIVDVTLTQAESIVSNQLAKPVFATFGKQIHSIDNLACESFDRLESGVRKVTQNGIIEMAQKRVTETISVVQTNTKQAQTLLMETMEQARVQMDSLRKQTSEHVNSVMNISQHLIGSIDKTLNAGESVLDRLLPPLHPETETSTSKSEDQTELGRLYERMVRFSDKIRRRMGQYAQEKWLMTILQSAMNFRDTILSIISKQLSTSLQMTIDQQKKPEASKEKQS